MLFALHLAPFRLVFCTKTHCILHQNAVHLAPKRSAFSSKTQCIKRQNAQNLVQMAVFLNKNSFHRIHKLSPFYIKTTFARIDFLRQDERLVAKRALIMLNLLLKTRQNSYVVNTREWASVVKTCTLATVSVGGCRVYATYILYHETQK